ncbi:MAG TPA: NAD(+) diphosphatase [Acidimicrobiales bacterium]|nr:NAD(+) diphosphatase [Acidimicrobiales bacterium]
MAHREAVACGPGGTEGAIGAAVRYAGRVPFVPLTTPPEPAPVAAAWLVVREGEVLVGDGAVAGSPPGGSPGWPAALPAELGAGTDTEPVFLGVEGGRACWAQGVGAGTPAPTGSRWVGLRAAGGILEADAWAMVGRAVQLVEWRRTSRFCGRCGSATVAVAGERAMRCPACGLAAYPRLAPAVIVLVERGAEVLLARNAGFRGRMFSTVAGFVEPGETLEEAVRREVDEEVGVRLGAIRYFGSQPWPFPHSLMVGFRAAWESGAVTVDGVEIAEAGWFGAGHLPELPPPLSIARWMIDAWADGADGAAGRRGDPAGG